MISSADPQTNTWYLEALADERGAWRTEVNPLPFRVGRRDNCHLRLRSASISGVHAEFASGDEGELIVKDLGSTNGTFVNLQRVESGTRVKEGDVVHFADQEFRVYGTDPAGMRSTAAVNPDVIQAMRGAAERRTALEAFIKERHFDVSFQPIVALETGGTYAFEALGRSVVHDFFKNTDEMFSEAKRLSLSLELSEALRFVAGSEAGQLPDSKPVFINTHPFELHAPNRLLDSLDQFRDEVGDRKVVMEIHEMAITDVKDFLSLRQELVGRNVDLAFDDFGRGQSRLLELSELRPEFVKFDRSAIEGGQSRGRRHGEMIKALVKMVHRMDRKTVAEGIETEEELEFCQSIGFDYGQGYLLGRPRPSDEPSTVDGFKLKR